LRRPRYGETATNLRRPQRKGRVVEDLDFSLRHDRARHVEYGGANLDSITVTTARGARFVFAGIAPL
jgi:hypothetical protein